MSLSVDQVTTAMPARMKSSVRLQVAYPFLRNYLLHPSPGSVSISTLVPGRANPVLSTYSLRSQGNRSARQAIGKLVIALPITNLQLIDSLYSPNNSPSNIAQTQRILQDVQKSPNGWSIATQLLHQPSLNAKFFGALTYTVNLNLRLSSSDPSQLSLITKQLLQQLLSLLFDDQILLHGGLFVVKKMLSNLSLIYIVNHSHWKQPLLTYITTLLNGAPVIIDESPSLTDDILNQSLSSLPSKLLDTVLIFSQIIVEEITKKEVSDQVDLHKVVHDWLFPSTERFLLAIARTSSPLPSTFMDCLGAWIAYASKAEFDSTVRYDFTSLLQFTIQVMASSSSSSPAMETLLDTLYTNPTFLKAETKLQLQSLIFGSWGSQFLSYQSEDSDQFARLTILFLEPDITSLAVKLADDSNDDKFDFLLRLTNFPGTPIVEESISNEFIDFWMQFADCFIEDDDRLSTMMKGDKLQNLHSKSRTFFIKVSQIYWSKIHIPQELEGFHDEFRIYRRDVGDLFESIFPIVKSPLYNNLIDNVLTSLNGTVSLSDIEASLYLINAIGSDFTENNIQSDALESVGKILDSDYLQLVTKQMIPNRFQHLVYTTVRFVSTIDWFYKSEKGLQYLPSMLNFLFDTMSMSAYQLISSKAISDICDNCRLSLQGLLPEFKTIIEQMVNDYTVEPLTRERVMNSYASIIQGVKDPSIQGAYLEEVVRLLGKLSFEVIETTDIINSTTDSATDGTMRKVDYLTSLLSSLSSLGKGMQLPDSADEIYQPSEIEAVNQYWQQDPLKIHSQILEIVNNFSMGNPGLADNLGVTEEIVHIFKSGLTETVGGPFVFDQAVIVQFIVAKFHTLQTTNTYPLLYGLYSSVIKAYHREMDVESVGRTLQIIFIDRISIIQTDPDIIQSVLNLLGTILSTRPSLLVSNIDMLEKVLAFGIDQLRSSERFVLRSLEYFWTKLIYLRRGNREDTVVVRRLFNETKLGYLATFNVLKYLLVTQRSNLEFFTEILKGLVAKYPMLVKGWLTESFREINDERERRGEKRIGGYDVFVKKMMISRGSRAGNEVVKDFWLEVNGLIDY